MKHSSSFTHDLKFGEETEDFVKDLFNGSFKVEVKTDRMAHITGNVFIEIYSRGKPSGLSTSDADYWIYAIPEIDVHIIITTERLKYIVKETFNGAFTLGGDNNTSKGVLIPIRNLIS